MIVMPTALIYGTPSMLSHQLDIEVNTIDLANMLKATMALYLGCSFIWLLGILKHGYWIFATALNIIFMLTLSAGRGWSMVVDGCPTRGYVFGIVAEFTIGIYAVYQLKSN